MVGGSIRKYCLDMAFQADFKYLEDVISSFSWVPKDANNGCKKLGLGKSENNAKEYLKVCICDQLPCNKAVRLQNIKSISMTAPIMIVVFSILNFYILKWKKYEKLIIVNRSKHVLLGYF